MRVYVRDRAGGKNVNHEPLLELFTRCLSVLPKSQVSSTFTCELKGSVLRIVRICLPRIIGHVHEIAMK